MQSAKRSGKLSARRLSKFKQVAEKRQAGLALVLEDIHDPHNAAAILRTCDGLGIQDVYFIFEKQPAYNPKKIGKVTSSSANKWLTFYIYRSTQECFKALKKKGYTIALTILDEQAEDASKVDLTDKKIALVVGNEHAGVSETAIKLADRKLYLPMAGFVQSFNVSVTTALFLYEIVRQRAASSTGSTGQYLLAKKEAAKLLADFKKR
jgi:tRNA (guanosine-2'-O-)-methyltransferase